MNLQPGFVPMFRPVAVPLVRVAVPLHPGMTHGPPPSPGQAHFFSGAALGPPPAPPPTSQSSSPHGLPPGMVSLGTTQAGQVPGSVSMVSSQSMSQQHNAPSPLMSIGLLGQAPQMSQAALHSSLQSQALLSGQSAGVLSAQQQGLMSGQQQSLIPGQQQGLLSGQQQGLLAGQQQGLLAGQQGLLAGQQQGLSQGLLSAQSPGVLSAQQQGLLVGQSQGMLGAHSPGLMAGLQHMPPPAGMTLGQLPPGQYSHNRLGFQDEAQRNINSGVGDQSELQSQVDEAPQDGGMAMLDHFNSDLNLDIDQDGYGAKAMTNPTGFCFCWAGARSTYGVFKGKAYFEVHISEHLAVDFGTDHQETNPHVVRVGWSIDAASMQLGEDPYSYGYGGTGKLSVNSKFSNYGEKFMAGDVIGALLDLESRPPTISYTKNGQWLGVAVPLHNFSVGDPNMALFPHVLSKNCGFKLNFGQMAPWYPPPQGYSYIDQLPMSCKVHGMHPPTQKSDCEMVMIIGLPGAGKTTWGINMQKGYPKKRYNIIGTDTLIDKMRVMGLPRRRNYHGRWDTLIDKATKCLNTLFQIASKRNRNYILDQTNVYPSAQRRKMKFFQGFYRKAAVLVPEDSELIRRSIKRTEEDGKFVPEEAVLEMKKNFQLPDPNSSLFDEINFVEMPVEVAQGLVQQYNQEGREKLPNKPRTFDRFGGNKNSNQGMSRGGQGYQNWPPNPGDNRNFTQPPPPPNWPQPSDNYPMKREGSDPHMDRKRRRSEQAGGSALDFIKQEYAEDDVDHQGMAHGWPGAGKIKDEPKSWDQFQGDMNQGMPPFQQNFQQQDIKHDNKPFRSSHDQDMSRQQGSMDRGFGTFGQQDSYQQDYNKGESWRGSEDRRGDGRQDDSRFGGRRQDSYGNRRQDEDTGRSQDRESGFGNRRRDDSSGFSNRRDTDSRNRRDDSGFGNRRESDSGYGNRRDNDRRENNSGFGDRRGNDSGFGSRRDNDSAFNDRRDRDSRYDSRRDNNSRFGNTRDSGSGFENRRENESQRLSEEPGLGRSGDQSGFGGRNFVQDNDRKQYNAGNWNENFSNSLGQPDSSIPPPGFQPNKLENFDQPGNLDSGNHSAMVHGFSSGGQDMMQSKAASSNNRRNFDDNKAAAPVATTGRTRQRKSKWDVPSDSPEPPPETPEAPSVGNPPPALPMGIFSQPPPPPPPPPPSQEEQAEMPNQNCWPPKPQPLLQMDLENMADKFGSFSEPGNSEDDQTGPPGKPNWGQGPESAEFQSPDDFNNKPRGPMNMRGSGRGFGMARDGPRFGSRTPGNQPRFGPPRGGGPRNFGPRNGPPFGGPPRPRGGNWNQPPPRGPMGGFEGRGGGPRNFGPRFNGPRMGGPRFPRMPGQQRWPRP